MKMGIQTSPVQPQTVTSQPRQGLRHELRAVKVVSHRELLRFWNDRNRVIALLIQPVLFLLVLGTGLSSLMSDGGHGVNLRTFMFPGVIAMSVISSAMSSAGSVVWDREFGFMREMLVAPVSRTAILAGKCVGGAFVATAQGVIVLCLAGLAGVPYSPTLMLTLLVEMAVGAFAITGFGLMMAARITKLQGFGGLTQMAMMPMMFLSGALFPLANLPGWLTVLTRVNPLTYTVDPLRHAVFGHLHVTAAQREAFDPGVTWWGWRLPAGFELALVVVAGAALLCAAIVRFRESD
jgi:daunorubicin resistance ABC transporter membrane protein